MKCELNNKLNNWYHGDVIMVLPLPVNLTTTLAKTLSFKQMIEIVPKLVIVILWPCYQIVSQFDVICLYL